MCEMKEKENYEEVVVLDKGLEDSYAINPGCCSSNSMKA